MRNSNRIGVRIHYCAVPLCFLVYWFVVPFVCLSATPSLPLLSLNGLRRRRPVTPFFSYPPLKQLLIHRSTQFKSNRIISYNPNCPGEDWDNCKLSLFVLPNTLCELSNSPQGLTNLTWCSWLN
jgi:hypothetical protein